MNIIISSIISIGKSLGAGSCTCQGTSELQMKVNLYIESQLHYDSTLVANFPIYAIMGKKV